MKLDISFYQRTDVVEIAQNLIGKVIVTNINGDISEGIITETEAYAGINDKASHAYGDRNTARTKTMYLGGGVAYVYLCYGIHHLFNVVTNIDGIPQAVLIRGIKPLAGIEHMLVRRKKKGIDKTFSSGPGTCSQAMGIRTTHDQSDLTGPNIYIEDRGILVPKQDIQIGPRIGIDYAEEDALLPYRFLWTH